MGHPQVEYGSNHARFIDPRGNSFYFSYSTLIAFYKIGPDSKTVVRRNEWGNTTGKHLNAIDGGNKKDRVTSEEFEKLFDEAFKED